MIRYGVGGGIKEEDANEDPQFHWKETGATGSEGQRQQIRLWWLAVDFPVLIFKMPAGWVRVESDSQWLDGVQGSHASRDKQEVKRRTDSRTDMSCCNSSMRSNLVSTLHYMVQGKEGFGLCCRSLLSFLSCALRTFAEACVTVSVTSNIYEHLYWY